MNGSFFLHSTTQKRRLILFTVIWKDALKGWLPNLITISGMLCIPFIIHFQEKELYLYSSILFGISWIMDFLDGKAARVFGQSSHTGEFLDPLADKVFTISFLLYFWSEVYVVISVPIISIGLALTMLRVYKIMYGKKVGKAPNIMASLAGKLKTNIEKIGISVLMLIPVSQNSCGISLEFSTITANSILGISLLFAIFSLSHQVRQV
tara:strand:- start:635 stop:1258 length:624 start_codon:yes stop_codon:yes gene_type:complete